VFEISHWINPCGIPHIEDTYLIAAIFTITIFEEVQWNKNHIAEDVLEVKIIRGQFLAGFFGIGAACNV